MLSDTDVAAIQIIKSGFSFVVIAIATSSALFCWGYYTSAFLQIQSKFDRLTMD
jgi:hypothetical protein